MCLIGLLGGAATYAPIWVRRMFKATRDKIASVLAMAGAWMLGHLVGPYPEPEPPRPDTKAGEVVAFPTERDLVKPERRDPPP